jgi:hypothetical protein
MTQGTAQLWATIDFFSRLLQTASFLDSYAPTLRVVGQPPGLVEKLDDKIYLNGQLRALGAVMPPSAN